MTRPQIAVSAAVVILALPLIAGLAFAGRIFHDGLQRFHTQRTFEYANIAWLKGDVAGAWRGYAQGAWQVMDGGLRVQVARYYLEQVDRLERSNRLAEAVEVCRQALNVVGEYDNGFGVFLQCYSMAWEYGN